MPVFVQAGQQVQGPLVKLFLEIVPDTLNLKQFRFVLLRVQKIFKLLAPYFLILLNYLIVVVCENFSLLLIFEIFINLRKAVIPQFQNILHDEL